MSAIITFLERYSFANKSNSKEIRLQMREAKDLVHELSLLSLQYKELSDEVIRLQTKVIQLLEKQPSANSTSLDGGNF